MPSRASPLPQVAGATQIYFRSWQVQPQKVMRRSDLLQELASPAPKSHAPLRFTAGAGKSSPKKSCAAQIYCRSWQVQPQKVMRRSDLLQELASPAPKSHAPLRFTAGAGKSSPKKSCAAQIYCRSWQVQPQKVMRRSDLLQELASPAPKSHAPLRFTAGAGKSSPKKSCAAQIYCRSWQVQPQKVMRRSDLLQELASPAPKSHAPLRFTAGAGKSSPKKSCAAQIYCRSWQVQPQKVMRRSDLL